MPEPVTAADRRRPARSFRLGVAGPVGTGKSSLIALLCRELARRPAPRRHHQRHLHRRGRPLPALRGGARPRRGSAPSRPAPARTPRSATTSPPTCSPSRTSRQTSTPSTSSSSSPAATTSPRPSPRPWSTPRSSSSTSPAAATSPARAAPASPAPTCSSSTRPTSRRTSASTCRACSPTPRAARDGRPVLSPCRGTTPPRVAELTAWSCGCLAAVARRHAHAGRPGPDGPALPRGATATPHTTRDDLPVVDRAAAGRVRAAIRADAWRCGCSSGAPTASGSPWSPPSRSCWPATRRPRGRRRRRRAPWRSSRSRAPSPTTCAAAGPPGPCGPGSPGAAP